MRNRTPYTNDELADLAIQCEDFCPLRAATFRELIELRKTSELKESDEKESTDSE
jgi:hypothetical protein